MSRQKKLTVTELNPHLVCVLCGGYFIDATTIIECLHTFCKSCILRYFEASTFCPVCDVQVHKSNPFLSIRPDRTVQNLVYKLVPHLHQNEMGSRKKFYSKNKSTPVSPEDGGCDIGRKYVLAEDLVSIALKPLPCHKKWDQPYSMDLPTRYLKCSAAVKIGQLQKLLRGKFNLPDHHPVRLFSSENKIVDDSFTIVDVSYQNSWLRNDLHTFYYNIYFSKRIKYDPCIDTQPYKPTVPTNFILPVKKEGKGSILAKEEHPQKRTPLARIAPAPPKSSTEMPSNVPPYNKMCASVHENNNSIVNSELLTTYKTIFPYQQSDIINISPIHMSQADNVLGNYGLSVLPFNNSIPTMIPGSFFDSSKLSNPIIPLGLTLTAPSMLCAAGTDLLSSIQIQPVPLLSDKDVIFSSANIQTSVVKSIELPISSVLDGPTQQISPSKKRSAELMFASQAPPEDKEVQLTISETGVIRVNGEGATNNLGGVLNPVETTEVCDLLSRIENGSLDDYSDDSKGSDVVGEKGNKLAQIKQEITSIINNLMDSDQSADVPSLAAHQKISTCSPPNQTKVLTPLNSQPINPFTKEIPPYSTLTASPTSSQRGVCSAETVVVAKSCATVSTSNKPNSTPKSKKTAAIGYKTLKSSPKGWNPVISRDKLLCRASSCAPKTNKFFKARNAASKNLTPPPKTPKDNQSGDLMNTSSLSNKNDVGQESSLSSRLPLSFLKNDITKGKPKATEKATNKPYAETGVGSALVSPTTSLGSVSVAHNSTHKIPIKDDQSLPFGRKSSQSGLEKSTCGQLSNIKQLDAVQSTSRLKQMPQSTQVVATQYRQNKGDSVTSRKKPDVPPINKSLMSSLPVNDPSLLQNLCTLFPSFYNSPVCSTAPQSPLDPASASIVPSSISQFVSNSLPCPDLSWPSAGLHGSSFLQNLILQSATLPMQDRISLASSPFVRQSSLYESLSLNVPSLPPSILNATSTDFIHRDKSSCSPSYSHEPKAVLSTTSPSSNAKVSQLKSPQTSPSKQAKFKPKHSNKSKILDLVQTKAASAVSKDETSAREHCNTISLVVQAPSTKLSEPPESVPMHPAQGQIDETNISCMQNSKSSETSAQSAPKTDKSTTQLRPGSEKKAISHNVRSITQICDNISKTLQKNSPETETICATDANCQSLDVPSYSRICSTTQNNVRELSIPSKCLLTVNKEPEVRESQSKAKDPIKGETATSSLLTSNSVQIPDKTLPQAHDEIEDKDSVQSTIDNESTGSKISGGPVSISETNLTVSSNDDKVKTIETKIIDCEASVSSSDRKLREEMTSLSVPEANPKPQLQTVSDVETESVPDKDPPHAPPDASVITPHVPVPPCLGENTGLKDNMEIVAEEPKIAEHINDMSEVIPKSADCLVIALEQTEVQSYNHSQPESAVPTKSHVEGTKQEVPTPDKEPSFLSDLSSIGDHITQPKDFATDATDFTLSELTPENLVSTLAPADSLMSHDLVIQNISAELPDQKTETVAHIVPVVSPVNPKVPIRDESPAINKSPQSTTTTAAQSKANAEHAASERSKTHVSAQSRSSAHNKTTQLVKTSNDVVSKSSAVPIQERHVPLVTTTNSYTANQTTASPVSHSHATKQQEASNSQYNDYSNHLASMSFYHSLNSFASPKPPVSNESWDNNNFFGNNSSEYPIASKPCTTTHQQTYLTPNDYRQAVPKVTNEQSHVGLYPTSNATSSDHMKAAQDAVAHYSNQTSKKADTSGYTTTQSNAMNKYTPSHNPFYNSSYNSNYMNFISNASSQGSSNLSSLMPTTGYGFPLSSAKVFGGQQSYMNFNQSATNNYMSSGNFAANSSNNYQNCMNQYAFPSSNMNSNFGNFPFSYYPNYNSYSHFYQGENMGLISPSASLMSSFPSVPSRSTLSPRASNGSQSINDFSFQSGLFPMMPFVPSRPASAITPLQSGMTQRPYATPQPKASQSATNKSNKSSPTSKSSTKKRTSQANKSNSSSRATYQSHKANTSSVPNYSTSAYGRSNATKMAQTASGVAAKDASRVVAPKSDNATQLKTPYSDPLEYCSTVGYGFPHTHFTSQHNHIGQHLPASTHTFLEAQQSANLKAAAGKSVPNNY